MAFGERRLKDPGRGVGSDNAGMGGRRALEDRR